MNRPIQAFKPMSLDDFEELLADCPDDERWELINGRVVRMMVGARWQHNRIISNLGDALDSRFRASGSSCRTLRETFRLKEATSSSFLLPDIMVFCGRLAGDAASLDDASIIFEVLSEGTARRDREDKWAVYQRLPSLRHYVMVARDTPHIEIIDRTGAEWSGHRIVDGLDARLSLPDFGIDLALRAVYRDVLE